jgi:hypothetical protein
VYLVRYAEEQQPTGFGLALALLFISTFQRVSTLKGANQFRYEMNYAVGLKMWENY